MRFYENGWAERLIKLLDENDRQLLCSQTRVLSKDEKGVIHEAKNRGKTYGAYMPLMFGEYLPDIRWSNVELYPESTEEPIPFVLGAAYAGSKRYWQYLRGMAGLRRYGCEEQYISLKVWQEGGQCILLKDFIVGHIYRKKSPYKQYSETIVFNYLWISRLLFPQSLWCKSFATALKRNKVCYKKAMTFFEQSADEYKDLQCYYTKIFTKKFSDVLGAHRAVKNKIVSKLIENRCKNLPQIAEKLSKNPSSHFGLFDGKMGQILWLEHYSYYSSEECWDSITSSLWEDVCQAVTTRQLSWCFSKGIAGIGWAVYYLYEQHFINVLPDRVLEDIDEQLQLCSIERMTDMSIAEGFGGLLVYCCMRIKYAKIQNKTLKWQPSFSLALHNKVKEALDFYTDLRLLTYALQFEELEQGHVDADDVTISMADVCDLKENYPKNVQYWTFELGDATLSATLLAMLNTK
jgi:hypothetical protein